MIKNIKQFFLLITFFCVGMVHAQTTDLIYHLGSSGSTVDIASVATDPSGNIFICGSFTGSAVEFNPLAVATAPTPIDAAGSGSGFIAAYNSSGILKKVISFGTTGVNKGVKVYVDPTTKNVYFLARASGSVKINGGNFGIAAGNGSMTLVKYDNNLTFKTAKFFTATPSVDKGDILNDISIQGPDLYVTGTLFGANIEFNPSPATPSRMVSSSGISDIVVAKYDTTTLTNAWVYRMGGVDADAGLGIDVDNSSNVYLTGYFTGQNIDIDPVGTKSVSDATNSIIAPSADAFIAKYDATTMTCLWAFNVGAGLTDRGNDILVNRSTGNIYVGGITKKDALDVDFDPSTTTSANYSGDGLNDLFVASYTAVGVYNWHLATGSAGEEELTSLAFDLNGNIVLSGFASGNVNFGNSKNITGLGGKDAYFAVISASSGLASAAYNLGGTSDEQANSVTVDATGRILVVGSYKGAGDYNLGAAATLPISGTQDGFISRHTLCTPPTITGTLTVCASATTQLTGSGTPASSNAWVSATSTVATVNPTGLVTGVAAGTSVITYTNNTGCSQTAVVTVYSAPTITGTLTTCVGSTTQLTGSGTAAASNAWLSATPSVATVNSSGLVTGVAAGTSIITYTNSLGCMKTAVVTVMTAPTIIGTLTACVSSTTQLTGSGAPAASNAWVSATPSVATVNSAGLVTGVGSGTSIITYTNSIGCTQTAVVTINPKPTITGILTTCIGSTTQLTGSGTAAASNAWVSATPSVATVNSTGLVTGVAVGTSIITYTNSNGCTQTATVTVNALPTITGTLSTCSTTQLTGSGTAAASNAWVSATPSVATVNSTGLVTGVSAGTSIITYTNSNGCTQTATVTITAAPTITGNLTTCIGSTTQLTGSGTAAASNAWVSATTAVASISSTGLVSGSAVGTSIITYTTNTGCTQTATVTVTAAPTITGTLTACVGSTTQLTGSGTAAASNAWVSSTPSIATVNSSGLVTGVAAGVCIITYTNSNGCTQTAGITINALPTIGGTLSACIGSTTQLTGSGTAAASNAWVSATPAVATVNSTGLVTGVAAGTSIITYTNSNGCSQTATVTINALPTITGTLATCSTTQLTGSGTAAASNAWVSATPAVATVNSTGLVTGVSAGTSIITYTNNTGCSQTATITINALPTITGITSACIGSTTQLTGSGTAAASNAWVSATPAVATVNSTGLVTGIAAGTSIITYTNNTGCSKTITVTINALPTITGTSSACIGSTTQLTGSGTAAASNAWISGTPAVATVNGTGLVTGVAAGTSIITYTNSNGCSQTATVTINALPTITGTLATCSTTQLTGSGTAAASNPWVSATPAVATVNSTGLVTGVTAGTSIITYTNSTGCSQTATVTINALPTIIGTLSACVGLTTQLTGSGTAATSNAWVSASPAVATVNSTGLVTGIAAGTSVITYTNSTGCSKTVTVTINALPIITGTLSACVGSTTQLTGSATAAASNAWVSATPAVATVNATGLVTGVSAGTSIITYTNSNGCSQTAIVTINALPTITGTLTACVGLTTQLTGSGTAAASNAWVSATPAVATISSTGLVTGVSVGTSIITYTNSNGCSQTATVTINALPTITGTLSVCVGFTTQLTGSGTAAASNAWTSSTPAVATVNSTTGLVTGVATGTSIITYTNSNGCSKTATITVTSTVAAGVSVTSSSTVICPGTSITLTASPINGGTPTYKWKLGTGYISGATNVTYTTTGALDNDSYTVEMTSSSSCASPAIATSTPVVITVNPTLVPVVTISTVSNTICLGDVITFTSAATNPGSTPSYVWYKNGVAITPAATGTSYSTTGAANSDVYSVVMTSNALCVSPSSDASNNITVTVNALPTITGTTTVCTGSTITLTGSGTANASNPWSSSTPAVATVSNTGVVTGVTAGTSDITYTNNNGCSETVTVTVNATPTVTGTLSICIGSTTQLTGSGTAAASNSWVSATPGVATVSSTGLVTGVSAGTSIITYTTNTGCSKTVTVTINALPTITGTPTVCVGSTTQLTGSGIASGTTPWTSATTSVATVSMAGVVTGVSGGTSVITYLNSNGCTATQVVTVNPANNPVVSITANNSTICAGTSITFNATPTDGGTAPTYKWKLGSGYISGETNATFTTTTAANGDSYSVEMTSNAICASTSIVNSNSIVISVSSSATPSVTVSTNTSNSICTNTSVTFTAIPGIGGSAPTYQWKLNGSAISNATNVTYTTSTLVNGDQISVDMVSNSTCASTPNASSLPITMTINPVVSAIVTLAASSTNVCAGAGVTFTASYTNEGSAPLFEWFVNSASQGAPSSSDTYTSASLPTGAQVSVKMTSNAACVTTATVSSNNITITVTPKVTPTVSITSDKSTICAGGAVIYTATPVNGGTASYQWKIDGANTGSATPSNVFTTSSLTDGNNVTVVLTSSIACVTSPTAISNGLAIFVAPQTQISSQPSDQSVCALGNNVTFSVGAIGDNLTYQWKTGSTNLANNTTYSGVTTKDLSISNVSNADLLGYKVTITGTCGTVTSNVATLTQSTNSITITAQPVTQVLEVGEMIQLSVSATGPTLSYQWKKNGVDLVNDSRITGANTSSLQISNALVTDSDNNYTCLIMSPCATQVSTNATVVTVTTATSTQDALTKGFVIAPNPSAGHFTLSNNYSPFVVEEIEIVSMEGIIVARKTVAGTTSLNEEIFAQDLPKGMYLLVIKGEGEQALLKVIFDK